MSTVAAMTGGYDVIHYHAVGPGLVAPLPRYFGRARVVQTIHGLDGERAKWGRVAQTILNVATWMSARVPHDTVTVSRGAGRPLPRALRPRRAPRSSTA